jgi:hypothetical protein
LASAKRSQAQQKRPHDSRLTITNPGRGESLAPFFS